MGEHRKGYVIAAFNFTDMLEVERDDSMNVYENDEQAVQAICRRLQSVLASLMKSTGEEESTFFMMSSVLYHRMIVMTIKKLTLHFTSVPPPLSIMLSISTLLNTAGSSPMEYLCLTFQHFKGIGDYIFTCQFNLRSI